MIITTIILIVVGPGNALWPLRNTLIDACLNITHLSEMQDSAGILKTENLVEDCLAFLTGKVTDSFTERCLYQIVLGFSSKGLKLNSVKEFFEKVVDVKEYECKCDCVTYLMKCIGVDQIKNWEQVLNFARWSFFRNIVNEKDNTPKSFCKNALLITDDIENKKLVAVYRHYLWHYSIEEPTFFFPNSRCDFIQVLEINVVYKSQEYWKKYDIYSKFNLFDMLFRVVCGSNWTSEQIKDVLEYLINDQVLNSEIKSYLIVPVFTVFNDCSLLDKLNDSLPNAFRSVTSCTDETCVKTITELFGFVYKVTKDTSSVPKLLNVVNSKWQVAHNLSKCLFTVEKTKPTQERLVDYTRRFLKVAYFFEGNDSQDLCKLLTERLSVTTWHLLYEVVINAIKIGWNAQTTRKFFKHVRKDNVLLGNKSITVKDITPLQKFLSENLNEEKWEILEKRQLNGDFIQFMNVPKIRKAVTFFFSDDFEKVYCYTFCPLANVIEILQKYDQPIGYSLVESDYIELVTLSWKRDVHNSSLILSLFYLRKFPIATEALNIINNMGNNDSQPIQSLVYTMMNAYDPFIVVIIVSRLHSISELAHFVNEGTMNGKGSPHDWILVVKVLIRIDPATARTLLSNMKLFSLNKIGPTILSLTNEEIIELASLLKGFSTNLIPSGKWMEMDLVNWLEFVHKDGKQCLGTAFLLKNHSKRIDELINQIKEHEESKWDKLCEM